jgi:hypothetical protein
MVSVGFTPVEVGKPDPDLGVCLAAAGLTDLARNPRRYAHGNARTRRLDRDVC